MKKPVVVTLCGSTRFIDTFNYWRTALTLDGKIVLSVEITLPQDTRSDPQHADFKVKQRLDWLHLRKIDLSDEIMVLNVGGYIGESTKREVLYALATKKKVIYLEGGKEVKDNATKEA